jgi:hypothetical protein
MRIFRCVGITFLLGILVTSCSVMRGEDPEEKVRTFLSSFQSSLAKSDDEILANFRVKQSREAVLSAVNILQNKDPFIVCESSLANGKILMEKELVTVEIPIRFSVKELKSADTASFTLVLGLTPSEKSYTITQINGEELYQEFQKIKNSNQWEAEQKLALKERLWVYESARNIQAKFDSVIWYSTYRQENYFYVVNGDWKNYFLDYDTRDQKNVGVLMGLTDSKGEIIIPLEYDLIGTLGFESKNMVEVTKDGKHGYFNINTKQIVVEPIYELIIPYDGDNAWAIVKQDSTYGWLDKQYKYTAGFSSTRMEEWFRNFGFLKHSLNLVNNAYSFCEIPNAGYAGNGIIMPPSYYSTYGIFNDIESGITTTSIPLHAWTEYIESSGSIMEIITGNINAVVTTIRERYIDGREEFYTSNSVVFVDENLGKLGSARISGEKISMHPIDSTLLEVRTPHDYWIFVEEETCEESNLFRHEYFSISANNEVVKLNSNRLYAQTQFVKLDSSYLMGTYQVYNRITEMEEQTTFLSVKTITYMRDEILAAYGYRPAAASPEYFNYLRKQDDPFFSSIEDVEQQLTDVDRHNLTFLNKILALMQQPTPA